MDAAEAAHRKSMELNDADANAHYTLGLVQAKRGDVDGAMECFRHAFAQDDNLRAFAAKDDDTASLRGAADFDALVAQAE